MNFFCCALHCFFHKPGRATAPSVLPVKVDEGDIHWLLYENGSIALVRVDNLTEKNITLRILPEDEMDFETASMSSFGTDNSL